MIGRNLRSGYTKEHNIGLAARRTAAYLALGILAFLCLFFIYILIINATRVHSEIQTGFSFLPGKNVQNNWNTLMNNQSLPIWQGMLNSLIVSSCAAALATYFSALTAYAIHVYDFRLKNFSFKFILMIMMVPTQVCTLGFIQMMTEWRWMDRCV